MQLEMTYKFVTVFPFSNICSLVVNCVKNFVAINESAMLNEER